MTWHAKALQTSYVTAPGAGAGGREEGEAAFPFSTASWFFLDAVDVTAPAGTPVIVGMREGVARMRAGLPRIRVVGGTVVSSLGRTIASGAHGFPEQDAKRKALNDFIRSTDVFDGVVGFDAATLDPSTGGIKPEF